MATKSNSRSGQAKKLKPPVIKTKAELIEAVRQLRQKKLEMLGIAADKERAQAALDERFANANAPLQEEADRLFSGIFKHCQDHRAELTPGEAKSFRLEDGTVVRWYLTPPKVEIEDGDEDALIDQIQEADMAEAYIRQPPPELNKEALIADRETVKFEGLSFSVGERFAVKLPDVTKEIERAIRKPASKKTTKR